MDDRKQSIIDHLEELRMRILKSLVCVVLFFAPGYLLAQPSIEALKRYAAPPGVLFYYLEPMALFFTRMKLGLVYACLFAFPVIAYQTWCFVAPGLFQKERDYITRLSGVSTLLFLVGVAFSLFGVFPALMRFSYGMSTADIAPMLQVGSVVNMATLLSLGFGIMFQLPIAVFFFVISGMISLDAMRKARPFIVLIIFVLAAVLTPPDIVSQLCMGLPTWLLFEISLFAVAKYAQRHKAAAADNDDDDNDDDDANAGLDNAAAGDPAAPAAVSEEPSWVAPDGSNSDIYPNDMISGGEPLAGTSPGRVRHLGPGRHGRSARGHRRS
ncbi:MAG: twin-arginine translocase subunit TatC [Lentisphaeria bacterium]|nr:twin-arginine translocase subunit TatC [Lentisphaeria bacterium]